jgi:hypothetical protein
MQKVKSESFVRVGVETVGRLILVMALALLTAGCNQTGLTPSPVPNPVTGQNPGDVKYYPSDQPVRLGIQRFYDGNFGLANNIFRMRLKNHPAM